jgi:WD40 repeat protein
MFVFTSRCRYRTHISLGKSNCTVQTRNFSLKVTKRCLASPSETNNYYWWYLLPMSTKYRTVAPITHQRDVYGQPVTALSFDPVSDTLWAGSNNGTCLAYHGTSAVRGVCFPVGGAVKKIIAGENYVRALAIAGEGVGSWGKGGVNKWYFR